MSHPPCCSHFLALQAYKRCQKREEMVAPSSTGRALGRARPRRRVGHTEPPALAVGPAEGARNAHVHPPRLRPHGPYLHLRAGHDPEGRAHLRRPTKQLSKTTRLTTRRGPPWKFAAALPTRRSQSASESSRRRLRAASAASAGSRGGALRGARGAELSEGLGGRRPRSASGRRSARSLPAPAPHGRRRPPPRVAAGCDKPVRHPLSRRSSLVGKSA